MSPHVLTASRPILVLNEGNMEQETTPSSMHQILARHGVTWRLGKSITLAFLAMLTLLAAGPQGQGMASADTPKPTDGTLAAAFDTASRHWSVPAPLLMAVGYVESHWEQRDGAPSLDQGYGIMHLIDSTEGKDGTLALAACQRRLRPSALGARRPE